MRLLSLALAATITATSAFAQDHAEPLPLQVGQPATGNAQLPAGTEVMLRLIENVTTSGNDWNESDTFALTVAHDIMLGQYVVIPAGSPAQGRVTSLSSRGAFGRSGKMDIEIEHIVVQERRIAVNGEFRQEGDGATLATLGGVLVAGIFGGFVTGKAPRSPTAANCSSLCRMR